MADKLNGEKDKTISFTLPLACQICLGRVKQPVTCCNSHVFCNPCLDAWLEVNKACPTCRVVIDESNPKRQLIGAGNAVVEQNNFFSSKVRRSRWELLFTDYENEITRLEQSVVQLKAENELLSRQVKDTPGQTAEACPQTSDVENLDMLLVLTKKLQHASNLYEEVKNDMNILKRENETVKETNTLLQKENKRIRFELGTHSPKKCSKSKIALQEQQIEFCRKEIATLTKALECNDAYIESMRKCSKCVHCADHDKMLDNSETRVEGQSPRTESPRRAEKSEGGSLVTPVKKFYGNKSKIRVLSESDSFDFDLPSPGGVSSTSTSSLSLQIQRVTSHVQEEAALTPRSLIKKKLKFDLGGQSPADNTADSINIFSPSAAPPAEGAELNVSQTPEWRDCMELFDKAERNVSERRTASQESAEEIRLWTSLKPN